MIDMDGNGSIDFKEFLSAMINKKQVTQDDMLSKAFKLFDIVSTSLNNDCSRMATEISQRKNFSVFSVVSSS